MQYLFFAVILYNSFQFINHFDNTKPGKQY